ncbi:site-specific integrase [Halorubrum sp. Atlit-28R]|uniref:tyrosine-type recombinase/integrase n=1 Tax=Halorubrum sp. Atlit-28R TaxID=2282129 RepID=UPI000EF1C1C2|nr:site-specific integrase [Halorubrum sp. Atlit-28R]RLM50991.1 site-specific integrase [Halorubrum sp. Atlit-28R]
MTSAESTTPATAVKMYLTKLEQENRAEWTLKAHRYRTGHFVRWCEETGRSDLSTLDGADLYEYRQWRKQDGDLNVVSLQTQLTTIRIFIEFCEDVGIVSDGLADTIQIPTVSTETSSRDATLGASRADQILEWLATDEYGSFDHVLMRLLWRTGMRLGELRAMDIGDYDAEEQWLHLVHRPAEGTPLKNGPNGERVINLDDRTCRIIETYIDEQRKESSAKQNTDCRQPLLTTTFGRPSTTTLRRHVYRCTQPCQRMGQCPYDAAMDECAAEGYNDVPSECPSIVRPHDIRRGSVTHWLREDVPVEVISERMDVSRSVIEDHYDRRDAETRARQRRGWVEDT